jgi:quercetin dioxygenase-like cupin family protein
VTTPVSLDDIVPARESDPSQFIGKARIHSVSEAMGTEQTKVRYVVFEPGARSRPHTHPFDQLLHYLQPGIVAIDGSDDIPVAAGEVVLLPAGVPHMHGATPDAPSSHLSIMRDIQSSDFAVPIPPHWQRYRDAP